MGTVGMTAAITVGVFGVDLDWVYTTFVPNAPAWKAKITVLDDMFTPRAREPARSTSAADAANPWSRKGVQDEEEYPTLRTARFELRPFAMSDIAPLTSLAGEHRIADTTIVIRHPYTAEYARRWITSHSQDWIARRALHWAALKYGDKHLAGYAGLVAINVAQGQAELRFWVGRGVERHSDGLEWSETVVDFAMNALGLRRIYSLQLRRHHLAARVLTNIGMQPEATVRRQVQNGGPMEDVVCWATRREGR